MRDVGIKFACIRSTASTYWPNYTLPHPAHLTRDGGGMGPPLAAAAHSSARDDSLDTAAEHDPAPDNVTCPLGHFTTFFPPSYKYVSRACFTPVANHSGVLQTILDQADATGLEIHLGLGLTSARGSSAEFWHQYGAAQQAIARELWELFGDDYRHVWTGVYTVTEVWNSRAWAAQREPFGQQFLQPLSKMVHATMKVSGDLTTDR